MRRANVRRPFDLCYIQLQSATFCCCIQADVQTSLALPRRMQLPSCHTIKTFGNGIPEPAIFQGYTPRCACSAGRPVMERSDLCSYSTMPHGHAGTSRCHRAIDVECTFEGQAGNVGNIARCVTIPCHTSLPWTLTDHPIMLN